MDQEQHLMDLLDHDRFPDPGSCGTIDKRSIDVGGSITVASLGSISWEIHKREDSWLLHEKIGILRMLLLLHHNMLYD
ncbi:hypothetical protein DY000_02049637 [Brassica cretica]|uniref:Uncharacterized protein n=1 Tax=Brassica cretica TaxID=69181 RepID=A0ABQ7ESX8_BRACR|nr:hypothetical protein DY000_02049637 [Brassica cretica]